MIVTAVVLLWKSGLVGGPANAPRPLGIPRIPLSIAGAPTLGSTEAPVVVIEFSDFECPFCGRFVQDSFPAFDKDLVATGKVRLAFRHFPLESIHRRARVAAVASVCAGHQDGFWPFHDKLFSAPLTADGPGLVAVAGTLGLSEGAMASCLADAATDAAVSADLALGRSLGVRSTPSFFVGAAKANGNVVVQRVIEGAPTYSNFLAVVNSVLQSK